MFSNYKPTWMVDAIYKITPSQLKAQGIKGILTDLDNTLIAWNNPDGTEELKNWLLEMKNAGIPVVVVSNNNSERVARAVAPFGLKYVHRALKPFSRGIKQGYQQLGLEKRRGRDDRRSNHDGCTRCQSCRCSQYFSETSDPNGFLENPI